MRGFKLGVALLATLFLTTQLVAQGLPTGTLAGNVTNDGKGLPGVAVTAKSPSLIGGSRTTVSGTNGDYAFPNLPPGEYTLTFELSGLQTATRTARVGASQQTREDVAMSLSSVIATTEVYAQAETVSQTSTQATTYNSDLLNKLPVTRTQLSAVILSPGVNQNGPSGAVTISGAQSFENLFTVNGVATIDNIRGTPFTLFIEDAIQETTTSTSSVSAEFGRFQGGVVNTITKSGGNNFSGTFRTSLANDAWTAVSPAKETRVQDILPTYEATLGGPIWKDKIWFFGAGRFNKTSEARQTAAPAPRIAYSRDNDEKRYEGKLTLSPVQNHTLTGSYIRIDRSQGPYGFDQLPFYDLASTYNRELPQELYSGNYNGVLTDKLFVEAQYSKRKFTFVNSGGSQTDLIGGTVLNDQAGGGYYHSPIFCAVCPGAEEKRDNEDILVKGTYFLSTGSIGSHNIVVGYDNFSGSRTSNNWQSGSSYFIYGTSAIFRGGDIYPVIDSSTYLGYYPIENEAKPSDVRTHSVFLNDTWRLNNNLSFNLGVRWDKNDVQDSRGVTTADDSAFSPRLSATYDVTGTGSLRFNASYAKYVGAPSETQVGAASNFGSPSSYYYYYEGPEINTNPNAPLVTRAQAIAAVFAWFGITGVNQFPSRPGVTPYRTVVPGFNTQIRQSLSSPNTNEFSVGVAGTVGPRVSFRVDGVYRNARDFYSVRTDLTTGKVTQNGRTADLGLVENVNDPLERKYYGLNTQFSARFGGLNVGGNWTWSHTYGNFVGENTGSGPLRSTVLQYPEYKQSTWNNATGDLSQDQRHRIRLFASYDVPLPKAFGLVSVSAIQSVDTGLPYGAVGAVRSARYVTNPGYISPPPNVAYYYTARDAFRTPVVYRTDVAMNYSYRIGPVEIFVQPQVVNLFNGQNIASNENSGNGINQTVRDRVSAGAGYADFNPFTTAPVRGVSGTGANWDLPSNFGTARSVFSYQTPRTFRMSLGLRF